MTSALDTGIHKTLCIAQYLWNTHCEIHWYEQRKCYLATWH